MSDLFVYEVQIDGPPAISVVAGSVLAAMNAAIEVYSDKHSFADSNDVVSVKRGQQIAKVG